MPEPNAELSEREFERGDDWSTKGAQALAAGRTEEGQACFRNAIKAYESALAVAPEDELLTRSNLMLCVGARWFGLGDRARALARYEEAIGLLATAPDLAREGEGREVLLQAKLNRAECRIADGDTAAARAEIEEVLAVEPDHPYAAILIERVGAS